MIDFTKETYFGICIITGVKVIYKLNKQGVLDIFLREIIVHNIIKKIIKINSRFLKYFK